MKDCIDISKTKKGYRILVETKETILEIKITNPKSKSILVNGGIKFVRPTLAKIENSITRGEKIHFSYKNNGSKVIAKSSEVVSATIFAEDDSWHYDAIEKR